jgi:hypothetical protein
MHSWFWPNNHRQPNPFSHTIFLYFLALVELFFPAQLSHFWPNHGPAGPSPPFSPSSGREWTPSLLHDSGRPPPPCATLPHHYSAARRRYDWCLLFPHETAPDQLPSLSFMTSKRIDWISTTAGRLPPLPRYLTSPPAYKRSSWRSEQTSLPPPFIAASLSPLPHRSWLPQVRTPSPSSSFT